MYVTRRLLRSTLEDTSVKQEPTDAASEEDMMLSPRKRRPLLQTQATKHAHQSKPGKSTTPSSASKSKSRGISPKQAENRGDKRHRHAGGNKQALLGMGMLVDARDSKERWCEAKILDLKAADESVYVHYVGWNTRYDCWLEAKCLAAHGSHTGAKKASSSWNGKDSLFHDPTKPTNPSDAKSKTMTKVVVKKASTSSKSKSKKKRPASDIENNDNAPPADETRGTSKRGATVKIEVAVDAVDEESERKSRRSSRREKIDLELEMDVHGETTTPNGQAVVVKSEAQVGPPPAKRTRTSPTATKATRVRPAAITTTATTKPPTAATRKASPRVGESAEQESKTDSEETPMPSQLQSPTVGMSTLRRSARAALVAKKAATKKRKSDDDDSDEEYKEEDEEDEEDEEEDDDGEDEVEESDDDLPVRRSSGKARRASSSSSCAPRRSSNTEITQWQTDPAYVATKERLSSIFRRRLLQRGELGADFQGSFQQAMSGSSAASTPRSTNDEANENKEETTKRPKKKKAKTPRHVMHDEEKAAAAQYYYAQHYYHMQAYQYHQYMYHQALVAQQLEQQRLAESKAAGSEEQTGEDGGVKKNSSDANNETAAAEGDAAGSEKAINSPPASEAPMMNGGIIDPRFIHARMDALEHQKRMQLYYQHYNQATERNLQILAASPTYLQSGANMWREQVQSGHQLPVEGQREVTADKKPTPTEPHDGDDVGVEEKRPVDAVVPPSTKHDEERQVENVSQGALTESKAASPQVTTPEATPEAVESAASASVNGSPRSPDGQAEDSSVDKKPSSARSSPSEDHTTAAKTETVLFELVL